MNILGDSRTRTFVILIGVVVIGGITFAVMRMGGESDTLAEKASKALPPPSALKGTPGNVTPEKYTKLLQEENIKRAEIAEQTKKSAIPTIIKTLEETGQTTGAGTGGTLGGTGQNIFGDINRGGFEGAGGLFGADTGGERPKTAQELRDERLREQRDRLEQERADRENQKEMERLQKMAEQERKSYLDSIAQRAKAMQSHAQAIFSSWGTVARQTYTAGTLSKVYDEEAKRLLAEAEKAGKEPLVAVVTPTVPGSNRFNTEPAVIKKNIIKAGTIAFGVLDTAVSSDEPGPILATIVGGKLKGGKLIGSIEVPKNGEKMILNFKTLSLPKQDNSVRVNVVAIDSSTARTALASDVDHHYLLRYGSLFASAFMDGLAKAIQNPPGTQNNQQQSGGTATTLVINQADASNVGQQGQSNASAEDYTDLEKYALVPLGKVGEEWGKAVKPYFNTPPTITVDQGTSLGLLFLSDLDLTPSEGATP